jgi:hypothetical protein
LFLSLDGSLSLSLGFLGFSPSSIRFLGRLSLSLGFLSCLMSFLSLDGSLSLSLGFLGFSFLSLDFLDSLYHIHVIFYFHKLTY